MHYHHCFKSNINPSWIAIQFHKSTLFNCVTVKLNSSEPERRSNRNTEIFMRCLRNRMTNKLFCSCGRNQYTKCEADGSLAIIKKKCDSKNSCLLTAENSAFGDPCVTVPKYIFLEHDCTTLSKHFNVFARVLSWFKTLKNLWFC